MGIKKIKSLLDALKDTDIEEVWIEKNGKKSGFSRKGICEESSSVQPESPVPKTPKSTEKESSSTGSAGRYYVKSPMVGTFFRALSPGGKPLASEGDFVTASQKVCVIEAMKVMKEVASTVEGKIVKILVRDNHPVEYGQPLFEMEPQMSADKERG